MFFLFRRFRQVCLLLMHFVLLLYLNQKFEMNRRNIDWDSVPDEELNETCWERVEALKEIFPAGIRHGVYGTLDWSWWFSKKMFYFTKSALWIGSTSAMLMVFPVIVEKELAEMAKAQLMQQQQMLLGPNPIGK